MAYDIGNLHDAIPLGNQSEAGVTEISFDVTDWAALYPTGAGTVASNPGVSDGLWLTYTRQNETDVYPVDASDLDLTDDILTWTVQSAVTDVAGQGTVVVHCTETGVEKRAVMAATIVATGHALAGDAPEPLASYLEDAETAIDALEAAIPVTEAVVLSVAGWAGGVTQTAEVAGMTADGTVIASPVPASIAKAVEFGVYCSAQAEDELTFTAASTPDAEITIGVVMLQ